MPLVPGVGNSLLCAYIISFSTRHMPGQQQQDRLACPLRSLPWARDLGLWILSADGPHFYLRTLPLDRGAGIWSIWWLCTKQTEIRNHVQMWLQKIPSNKKGTTSTNERREISTGRGEEKKQNPPKTILQKFNFRLKYLTLKTAFLVVSEIPEKSLAFSMLLSCLHLRIKRNTSRGQLMHREEKLSVRNEWY